VREWAARGETVTLRGPTTSSSSGSPPPHQPAGQAATSYLSAQPETTGQPRNSDRLRSCELRRALRVVAAPGTGCGAALVAGWVIAGWATKRRAAPTRQLRPGGQPGHHQIH